jgi:hypothetical protein
MPSTTHQALVELFRARPSLATALLAPLATLPSFASTSPTEAALDQLVPTEFRADLVVELNDAAGEVLAAIVVEVQLGADPDKLWTWPVYLAALRARLRRPVWLLVIAPDEAVAAWARTPIELVPGAPYRLALVLGPGELPPLPDPIVATHQPELALLAAVAHGHDDNDALLPTLLAALRAVDRDHRIGYLSMLLAVLPPAARKRLEDLMLNPAFADIKLPSPWQEQLDERDVRAKADAILAVLDARGVAVPDDVRTRILACADIPTLDRWIRRAATLKTAVAVVREPAKKSATARRPPRR